MFNNWMKRNGKVYISEQEEQFRFGKYLENSAIVEEHNARYEAGLETYDLELNLFADMDNREFSNIYLMMNGPSFERRVGDTKKCTGSQAPTSNIPDSIDWSSKGGVTPIKNQGQCGSCWAFSTTGALEGEHFRKNGTLDSYSEQQLVDCSKSYGNGGCNGGLMNMSFWYVIDHGITLETKYPYKGVGGTCHYTDADKAWGISNCVDVTVDVEKALLASIAQQPTSVAIEADHASFQLYKSGVYSGNCGTKLDHGVLAVGFGDLSGKPYIKVKNSWGSTWGTAGYIYMARKGDGKGQCGINMAASFPIA